MVDYVHLRVSLAVLLIDDFTGKILPVSKSRVTAEGRGRPVKKPEGFWVFANLPDSLVWVQAEGAGYVRERRAVDLTCLDQRNPLIKIRMRPDRTYEMREKGAPLVVHLPADTSFLAFCREEALCKRLLSDYAEGEKEIRIYNKENEELEGKVCCITGKEEQYEQLCLGPLMDEEKGLYRLEQGLTSSYKKIGTRIYPATAAVSREEGEYFFLLESNGKKEVWCTCVAKRGKKTVEKKIKLTAGRENREDFRETVEW